MMLSGELEHVWDNHLVNLAELFQNLYNDSSLLDVSLSCQGGFLRAHKLVLSACSPYFKQVFEENPCKHPTIILTAVARDDMAKLIEFMYRGRVVMSRERLQVILRLATDLEVKGFENIQKKPNHCQQQKGAQQLKKSLMNDESLAAKQSLVLISNGEKAKENKNISNVKRDADDPSEIDEDGQNDMNVNADCDMCNRTFETKKELQTHKKSHQDKNFHCDFCDKLFTRASHLIRHRRVHTGERPFNCKYCCKDFARQDKLKLHIRTTHTDVSKIGCRSSNATGKSLIIQRGTCNMEEDEQEMVRSEGTNDHITLDNFIDDDLREKRRGRPKKHKLTTDVLKVKRSRGRPRKDVSVSNALATDNYDLSNLPFGDISYLTMSPAMPIEPLVEIKMDDSSANTKLERHAEDEGQSDSKSE